MRGMPVRSARTLEVLRPLPALLVRELQTAEVEALVGGLVDAGWRPGQLAARIGAAPAQGSPEADAAAAVGLLHDLRSTVPPDVAHAREHAERRHRREEDGAVPATAEVRERALAEIRAQLKGVPSRRTPPPERTRPACSLCDGEGSFFVTRQVHLCRRCVAVLATGEARLSATG
jgi:ribosomal protein S14